MSLPFYIFDPTTNDAASRVRGIGRYVDILRENLSEHAIFTSNVKEIPYESVCVIPFYQFLQSPFTYSKMAKKQVAVIHDIIPLQYPQNFPSGIKGKLYTLLNSILLNNFDAIITDSNASKKSIVSLLGVPEGKVHVIYPVLSTRLTSNKKPNPSHAQNKPYFVYVGDATWNKNIVHIAQAVKSVQVNCKFIGSLFDKNKIELLGQSKDRINPWQYEQFDFYKEAEGSEYINLEGFVSNDKLAELYTNATANLLVSRDEGFGFSYLEAAFFGCPSILADRPIFHEIAADTALFADPENTAKIAENIKKMQDQKQREALVAKLKNRVAFFSPTKFKEDFLKVISLQSA